MLMLDTLKNRFENNMQRHPDMTWEEVKGRLWEHGYVLDILRDMEETGGEPDAIGYDDIGRIIFCDCSAESPEGRRGLCFDDAGLDRCSNDAPAGSAEHQAEMIGVKLITEEIYQRLQTLGEFDLSTSSWIDAPAKVIQSGEGLFCERRFGRVFTFHCDAGSYSSDRGWRGYICL